MKLKKSLGQNFFNNETLAKKVVNTAFFVSQESVLEIGPGDGFFTRMFHDICKNITVIEKDDILAQNLSHRFSDIEVINKDILDLDLNAIQNSGKTLVFGSLPYNISKVIIRKFVSSLLFKDFYFIVQKEVAQKYVDSKKSSLQYLTTKYYVDTKIIFDIHPGSFTPRPKVQSSFIHMKMNENRKLVPEKTFFKFCREAFRSPRKTLRNNLRSIIADTNDEIYDKRAEELNFTEFCKLIINSKVV